jgi:D-tagatose-1,6-bisphosphate aldolase subunit GatZ/KbaZ
MARQTLDPRTGNASERLRSILVENRQGQPLGVYSICSANRFVLETGMLQAKRDGSILLIESTSNQVNQFGGYTGQTPADFVRHIYEMARESEFPQDRIVLGGDHLGPHVWRNEPSRAAMQKACTLVGDYIRAGFTKIHLDASMRCADDEGDRQKPLPDELVSARAAQLCAAAERAYQELRLDVAPPLYVIGTEVPTPGGGLMGSHAPAVTNTDDLARTLQLSREALRTSSLEDAWERVIAVVVQPGVEFGDAAVLPYEAANARALSQYVVNHWSGVYEAHSTDYQTEGALRSMVHDHFAILKVGPWLTFTFREAVFALEEIEKEWLSSRSGVQLSGVHEALERAMLDNPVHWKGYYQGREAELRFSRKYSYSDRARYYWPEPYVAEALHQLILNLDRRPPPISLLSQYLPNQAEAVRNGSLVSRPAHLIRHKILEVIDRYAYACGCGDSTIPQTESRNAT